MSVRQNVFRQSVFRQNVRVPWNRWRKDYLTSLREFHRTSGKNEVAVQVGDVVQVHDDAKRINWRLAVIESLIAGIHGLVRVAANIRTSTGCTNHPIAKLYPLEVRATTPPTNCTVEESSEKNYEPLSNLPPKERRTAAVAAKEKIKDWTSSLMHPSEDVAE